MLVLRPPAPAPKQIRPAMFNVVLYQPEIPANTGNIGRTCVVTGSRLHLVGPLGFSLDDRMLQRAGLGYWRSLDVCVYNNWSEFLQVNGLITDDARLHFLTKKARRTYAEASYVEGDYLVFGRESTGIDEEVLAAAPERCERIPMLADAVSIHDADTWTAPERGVGVTGMGAESTGAGGVTGATRAESPLLAQDICGNFIDPSDYRISALNLSNAAAVVLYEALRQTGFASM